MRLIKVLYRQHIDRMFKKHWRIQGQRNPIETGAANILKEKGIPVFDANELVKEARKIYNLNIVGITPKPVKLDESHPDWHDDVCYLYRDENVLLLGDQQAKKITNSVEIQEGLPHEYKKIELTPQQNEKIQNLILSSYLYDAEQKKLPIKKDPLRPAWVFPRDFGITFSRRCLLMITRLLHFCETESDVNISNRRLVLNDIKLSVPFLKENDKLLFDLNAEHMLFSKNPVKNFTNSTGQDLDLTDIHPVHFTNTLVPENIYKFENAYPLKSCNSKYIPHTVFLYYDSTQVQNLYEEEITEEQILGRSLMKTFAAAAAYARAKYGHDVKELPEPVSLHCVHTDSRMFHFGALQLNTLDLNENGLKNIWFSVPRMPLFAACEYRTGQTVLEEYNPNVVRCLLSFYNYS